ncbi:MAG TPA: glycosyltransferase family 1 protein [Candidatus Saccharimonadales bacterium]|nr:glycosyltransferase family 1 protein [Candidatus Saccharimonadales bacterium]
MKIYIEGTPVFTPKRWGVGQYTKRLIEAMAKLEPKNEYTIFGFHFLAKRSKPYLPLEHPSIRYRFIRFLPGRGYSFLFKKGIRIPIDLLLGTKPEIVLYPNFVRWPLATKAKSVIVIHDIGSFLQFGQHADPKNREYMRKYVPYSIERTDHIFAVSAFSKQEIANVYKVDPKRISVVSPALDHDQFYVRSDKEVAHVRKKYELPQNFVLFVSTMEPRKNLVGLLDAFASLPAKLQDEFPLMMVGDKGWADGEIKERLERYKGLPIRWLGYVPDEDIAAVFTAASLFVFPSFYEGFGMPPLEAMACGTPVVCSNTSALPESVGDAALTVDPNSVKSIAAGIKKVLTTPTLAAELRKKGLKQASKSTWENSARIALAEFKKLVGE